MSNKSIISLLIAIVCIIVLAVCWTGLVGRNEATNWQYIQGIRGSEELREKSGYYAKWFATVATYPRAMILLFNDKEGEGDADDERIKVTFNDTGEAKMCATLVLSSPLGSDLQGKFHKVFAGSLDGIKTAMRSYLVNCMKATAPLMSASEHQSARKAEFQALVEEMLKKGIYKMRKVEKELKDRTDESGQPITVFATEIILDKDGAPMVSEPSPLAKYGMGVLQFSIEGTEYDPKTKEQFETKKDSFLKAENSKAEREQEVQKRLMIVEKGLREKAEVTAKANMVKEKAVVEAQQKVEMAEKKKAELETQANMKLEVAKIEKQEAETRANMDLEVAKIQAEAAKKQALAIVSLAEAEEKRIQLAGAITEKDRVLAEIAMNRDTKVSANLAEIRVPGVIINSDGSQNGSGGGVLGNLINLLIMQKSGILPDNTISEAAATVN